jgi:hypothetical protein
MASPLASQGAKGRPIVFIENKGVILVSTKKSPIYRTNLPTFSRLSFVAAANVWK